MKKLLMLICIMTFLSVVTALNVGFDEEDDGFGVQLFAPDESTYWVYNQSQNCIMTNIFDQWLNTSNKPLFDALSIGRPTSRASGELYVDDRILLGSIEVGDWLYNQTLAGNDLFVNVAGDTMTGDLTLNRGVNHSGIHLNNTQENVIGLYFNDGIDTFLRYTKDSDTYKGDGASIEISGGVESGGINKSIIFGSHGAEPITPYMTIYISGWKKGNVDIGNTLTIQKGANITTGTLNVGNCTGQAYRGCFVQTDAYAENSSVLVNDALKDRTISMFANGSAYFMMRDMSNDIEALFGTSTQGVFFLGSVTAHDVDIRTANLRRFFINHSSQYISMPSAIGGFSVGRTEATKTHLIDFYVPTLTYDVMRIQTFRPDIDFVDISSNAHDYRQGVDANNLVIKKDAGSDGTYEDTLLTFYGANGNAEFIHNITADNFLERTALFTSARGNAKDYIKNFSYYIDNGEINHSKFYGYTTYEKPDFSRPVTQESEIMIWNGTAEVPIIVEDIIYPYNITVEATATNEEVSVLRQRVYEQDLIIEDLQRRIEILERGGLTP